jgi:hypothetical protein
VLAGTAADKAGGRARGKDDMIEAVAAARAAPTGKRITVANHRNGCIEPLRVVATTRQTAVRARRSGALRDEEQRAHPLESCRSCLGSERC